MLSIPSAVFVEASWYGSLRPTVEISRGDDTRTGVGGSRWDIKGSSELSEGVTAVYRFKDKFDTSSTTSQPGGGLNDAELSSGFGTLTMGQIWSAALQRTHMQFGYPFPLSGR